MSHENVVAGSSSRLDRRTVVGIVTVLAFAACTVYVSWLGYYAHPVLTAVFVTLSAATVVVPQIRATVFPVLIVLISSVALLMFHDHTASGQFAMWRVWRVLPGASFLWLPQLTLALTFQAIGLSTGTSLSRPATAVAAAGFMVVPRGMSDVITGYEELLPSVVVALYVAVAAIVRFRRPSARLYLWSIIEPTAVVFLGWSVVYLGGGLQYVSNDLRWLIPFFAVPSCATAAVTNLAWLARARRARNPA
jgi:hypothetical protein